MFGRTLAAMAIGMLLVCLLCTAALGAPEAPKGSHVTSARDILAEAGVRGGLVVHVGCGDGKLTAALRAGESYLVHGLDGDAANVEKARAHVHSLGLDGEVSVERWAAARLPYADNLVNLLVSEDLGGVPMAEVMRVLAPGGAACVRQNGKWTKTVKPRPKEMDEWTHALHGPDNNAVADDSLVAPPRHLQWTGGPTWARSHDHLASISVVVSSGGRLFYIADEGPVAFVALPARWFLTARDAFSGVVLWKRPIRPWEGHLRGFRSGPPHISRRLVAIGDRVYVTLGYDKPLSELDAATGKTLRTYEDTDGTDEIVVCDGVLYVVAGDRAAEEKAEQAWRRGVTPPVHNKRIGAISAESGKLLWRKSDRDTAEVMPTTLAVAGGRVFFQNTEAVICLDAPLGRRLWRAKRRVSRSRLGWSTPTLVVYDGVVLSADRAADAAAGEGGGATDRLEWIPSSRGGQAPAGELIAFSAADGERLWSCPCRECYNAPVDVLVAGGLVWTGRLVRAREPGITAGRDPKTGEIKRTRDPDAKFFTVGMGHHRCHRNKATNRYLVLGRAGVEFIDLATGRGVADHWVRGTCQYGVMPCNGLLYAPPHSCACYIEAKLNGFNALAATRSPAPPGAKQAPRLEKGPAFGEVAAEASAPPGDDWPTHRHDAARSGCTAAKVAKALEQAWQAELAGRLSSVVVAAGKVFVAQIDAHSVHALDAGTGRPAWRYVAGGRVDSPPTIHKGMALFGSADGYVYCLRASDGELVWRFRAAPEDRRIVAYGRLESAWPVHGSVLVVGGAAYFAAGRSAFTDGGIRLYSLDAATGRVLSEKRIDGRDPKTHLEPREIVRGTHMSGSLPDVLASDGKSVWMRHRRFDLQLAAQPADVPHLFSSTGFMDGSWWHRTYFQVGTGMRSGYGGWPVVGRSKPAGRLLVTRGPAIYGFGRTSYNASGSHVGLDAARAYHHRGGARGTGYRLFAMSRGPGRREKRPAAPAKAKPKPKGKVAKGKPQTAKSYKWTQDAGLLVRAMVLADGKLLIAGPPDVFAEDVKDPIAVWEGERGGLLRIVSAADGKMLAEYKLAGLPVFDGMAVAAGGVYMATLDGKVVCYSSRK